MNPDPEDDEPDEPDERTKEIWIAARGANPWDDDYEKHSDKFPNSRLDAGEKAEQLNE